MRNVMNLRDRCHGYRKSLCRPEAKTSYFQWLQPLVAKVQAKGGRAATVPAGTLGPSKNLGGAI